MVNSATRSPSRLWLPIACLLFLVGCGGPIRVPIEGNVRFSDGEPVRTGKIELRGREPGVRAAAVLDDEGRFALRTDDGALGLPPGDYDVAIVQIVLVEHRSLEEHGHGRPLSRKYADYFTSGLTASVPESGIRDLVITVEP
ncbi:MAG: carboxypeptidase regulatory-like domain-containing protein [Planctomycetaceae bacterium]|nr:MAG: carboxypeptidase regulatory-like domain-containing protein [Planctomycetaceae bacterium]